MQAGLSRQQRDADTGRIAVPSYRSMIAPDAIAS